MHSEAERSLRTKLKAELDKCIIHKGALEFGEDFRWGLNFAESLAKEFKKWLDFGNALNILINHVMRALPVQDNPPSGKLIELLSALEVATLEDDIFAFLKTIPRPYSLILPFPGATPAEFPDLSISQKVSLFVMKKDHPLLAYRQESRFPSLSALASVKSGSPFTVGHRYLRIKCEGYAKSDIKDSALAEAFSVLKQVLYLGTICKVFEQKREWSVWGGNRKSNLVLIDETNADIPALPIGLISEMAEHIARYSPTSDLIKFDPMKNSLLFRLGKLLDASIDDINRVPISTASEWGFEARGNSNETVSFLFTCIALEAVLGDPKTKVNVTRTLADRCAYLTGTTVESRKRFRENFEKLYEHRSHLVHGRQVQIDPEGEESLHWGGRILGNILGKELGSFVPMKGEQGKQK